MCTKLTGKIKQYLSLVYNNARVSGIIIKINHHRQLNLLETQKLVLIRRGRLIPIYAQQVVLTSQTFLPAFLFTLVTKESCLLNMLDYTNQTKAAHQACFLYYSFTATSIVVWFIFGHHSM